MSVAQPSRSVAEILRAHVKLELECIDRLYLNVFQPTHDFRLGRMLANNLSALRKLGFAANRRLLDVQKASEDCLIGEELFREVTTPCQVGNHRASALPYGNPVTLALLQLLLLFRLLPCGFRSKELREHYAQLLGKDPQQCTQGQMTYQLRRLRLHGLIERQAKTHSYRVTDKGLRVSLFFTRSYIQVVRKGRGEMESPRKPFTTERGRHRSRTRAHVRQT